MTFTGADPEIVERAAALAAVARDEAEAIERERRLPDPLVESLRDAGLFHLWVPGELGGLDAGVGTFMEVVRTLAEGEAAAGWVVMIAAETNALAQWMPRETAEEIFGGDARPICVGTLNPPAGTLRPVAGGYVAEGQWPFGSGFPNA
ncbi:MAG: hydroxylase, partial [Chloroflexi bacterium]|nr:hydroxylase [Chloroflexota bacterium]